MTDDIHSSTNNNRTSFFRMTLNCIREVCNFSFNVLWFIGEILIVFLDTDDDF